MGNRSGTRCQTKLERRLTEILRGELASHGISVRRWKRSNAGEADFELSMIDIPRPRTPYALGVAFHEMGHIHHCRNNGRYRTFPMYSMEYMAETYALEKLKMYGLPIMEYRAYATKYVLTCLAKYKNGGGDMNEVPAEIRRWAGVRLREWNAATYVTVRDRNVNKRGDIRVEYR